MQNKRIQKVISHEKKGIIHTHIENNLKNYIIVTVIFLIRSSSRSVIYK